MTFPGSELYWRWVPGYEGYYQVSVFGNVRSVDRRVVHETGFVQNRRGKILNLVPLGTDGYLCVRLSKDGHAVTRKVHQLVLEAFVGPRPPGYEARHLDGNNMDNRAPKLAWGTPKQNVQDTLCHGHHRWQRAISKESSGM